MHPDRPVRERPPREPGRSVEGKTNSGGPIQPSPRRILSAEIFEAQVGVPSRQNISAHGFKPDCSERETSTRQNQNGEACGLLPFPSCPEGWNRATNATDSSPAPFYLLHDYALTALKMRAI